MSITLSQRDKYSGQMLRVESVCHSRSHAGDRRLSVRRDVSPEDHLRVTETLFPATNTFTFAFLDTVGGPLAVNSRNIECICMQKCVITKKTKQSHCFTEKNQASVS